MNPLGGTELQLGFLQKYVDNELLSKFNITTSVPEKTPLSKDKINILWQKIVMINLTLPLGSRINVITISMIGMCLTHIGTMKNLE